LRAALLRLVFCVVPSALAFGAGLLAGGPQSLGPQPASWEYVPGRVIVKFRGFAADALRGARVAGAPLHEVPLSPELDRLKGAYGVTQIEPVFRDFEVRDESAKVVRVETMREHVERIAAPFSQGFALNYGIAPAGLFRGHL